MRNAARQNRENPLLPQTAHSGDVLEKLRWAQARCNRSPRSAEPVTEWGPAARSFRGAAALMWRRRHVWR